MEKTNNGKTKVYRYMQPIIITWSDGRSFHSYEERFWEDSDLECQSKEIRKLKKIIEKNGARLIYDRTKHLLESIYKTNLNNTIGPAILLGGNDNDNTAAVVSVGMHELAHHLLLKKNSHPKNVITGEKKAWKLAAKLAFQNNLPFDQKAREKALNDHIKAKERMANTIKSSIFNLEKQGPYFVDNIAIYLLNDVREPKRRITGLNLIIMKKLHLQKKFIEFRDPGKGKIKVINHLKKEVIILNGQLLTQAIGMGLIASETSVIARYSSKIISYADIEMGAKYIELGSIVYPNINESFIYYDKDSDKSINQMNNVKKDVFRRYSENIPFKINTCGFMAFFKDFKGRNVMSMEILSPSIFFKMARKRILESFLIEMMLTKNSKEDYPPLPLGDLNDFLKRILATTDFLEYRGVGGSTMILKQGSVIGGSVFSIGEDPFSISLYSKI